MTYVGEKRRTYQRNRYTKRRETAFRYLGGKCVVCGSTEDLELDHITPSQKIKKVSAMWGYSEKKWLEELEKCQLLCSTCHIKKTLDNRDGGRGHFRHGLRSTYRVKNCRCNECTQANTVYNRKLRARHAGEV